MKKITYLTVLFAFSSPSIAQWSYFDDESEFTGHQLSQQRSVSAYKANQHEPLQSYQYIENDHDEVTDIFNRDQAYKGIRYSYLADHGDDKSVYFSGEISSDEQHLSSSYASGNATYGFSAGSGENFVKTNQLYTGIDPYFVHGGSHAVFRYYGANAGYAYSNKLMFYVGATTVKAQRLDDRHGVYIGGYSKYLSGALIKFTRDSQVIGQGVNLTANINKYKLSYRQLSRDSGAHAKTIALSTPTSLVNSGEFGFSLESINNPLYRNQDDERIMFSFSGSFGKHKPRMMLDEEYPARAEKSNKVRLAVIGGGVAAGVLIASSGSSSKDNQEAIVARTQHDAAFQVLNKINPESVRLNREHGGFLYRNPDGSYGYTTPKLGQVASISLGDVTVPNGTQRTASYHTHAGPDPRYDNENFSPQDIRADNIIGIDGYLGTPAGRIKFHNHDTNQVILLGTIAN